MIIFILYRFALCFPRLISYFLLLLRYQKPITTYFWTFSSTPSSYHYSIHKLHQWMSAWDATAYVPSDLIINKFNQDRLYLHPGNWTYYLALIACDTDALKIDSSLTIQPPTLYFHHRNSTYYLALITYIVICYLNNFVCVKESQYLV